MPTVRAMVIHQGASNDPKDRYVNTLHFGTSGDIHQNAQLVENIGDALDDLYSALDPYMPDSLTREYRLYDLSQATPREPVYVTPLSQPANEGTAVLPFEVAAVLSFYSFRNTPRSRGRLYLGPLVQSVAVPGGPNRDPHIAPAFRAAVLAGAQAMGANIRSGAGTESSGYWGIRVAATDGGTLATVTDAWMDDAFDTMRKRGTAATMRDEVSIPQS
jgi:hypothetical protein